MQKKIVKNANIWYYIIGGKSSKMEEKEDKIKEQEKSSVSVIDKIETNDEKRELDDSNQEVIQLQIPNENKKNKWRIICVIIITCIIIGALH